MQHLSETSFGKWGGDTPTPWVRTLNLSHCSSTAPCVLPAWVTCSWVPHFMGGDGDFGRGLMETLFIFMSVSHGSLLLCKAVF